MNIENALKVLHAAIANRFGKNVDTECGEATLFISHRGVEMTNECGIIQAQGPARVAKVLRRKRLI